MKRKLLILAVIASVLTLALPSWAQEVLSETEQQAGKQEKYKYTANFIKSIMEGNVEVKDLEIIIDIAPDDNTLFDTALENLTKEDIITGFPAQILFDKAFKDNADMTHQTAAIIEKIGGNPDELIVHYEIRGVSMFPSVDDGKKEYSIEKDGTLLGYWADVLPDSDNDKVLAVAKVLLDNNATINGKIHYMINTFGSEESKKLLESAEEAREE